jgi:hypothetical protein
MAGDCRRSAGHGDSSWWRFPERGIIEAGMSRDETFKETIDADKNRWELCSRVLARKDVIEKLSEAW